MKKRLSLLLLTTLLLAAIFAVTAFAAGDKTVVYIKDGGAGDGSSADSPFGTLTKCYDALDLTKDCTIVVCGPYTQKVNWVYHDKSGYSGSVTFTSVYGGTDYRKTGGAAYRFEEVRFACFGDTRFENINLTALGSKYLLVGQHNPITIGENVTISGGSGLTGGQVAKAFTVVGGYVSGFNNPPASSDKDTNITILSGDKMYVIPFSYSIGDSYTGTANVHIGGNAKVGVLHGSSVYKDGAVLGNVKYTIDGSPVISEFYGCTSDVTVASYEFNWTSGTIENFEWVCSNTPSKTLTVTGDRVLNASATAQKNANFASLAANFDKVNTVKGENEPQPLENATVVYVKDGGDGNGESADKALSSLESAYAALDLSKDCTIVVCGDFTLGKEFNYGKDYTGSVTLTSVYGGKDYRSDAAFSIGNVRYILYGETVFDNININAKGEYCIILAQHNPFTLGEGVALTTTGRMTGATTAKSFTIIGGYENKYGSFKGESAKDTSITVLSGEKVYIVAFSRNVLGSYTGTANVHVGGNANVSVLHGSSAYPANIIVGDVKVTVDGNANIAQFYGCTQVTTASSYEFIWKSGTIGGFEWLCSQTPDAKLTVNGIKLLRASDAVKATEAYAKIAPEFDKTAGLDETVSFLERIPAVNPKNAYAAARGLFMLKLAQGYDTTGTNFGLTDGLNRAAAIVQVIRFLGVEEEVKSGSFAHPFTDVPDWANNYIGYAYQNKITSGMSATTFDPNGLVTEAQFLTFMLRAIGYSDAAGDFVWSNPFSLASKAGMIPTDKASASFLRGEAFTTCWRTLFAMRKDGTQVCTKLVTLGVFTTDELSSASTEAKTATEPKKKEDKNTPTLEGYNVISVADYEDKTMLGFLSQFVGFFSGYEFASEGGKLLVAMPDEWFELCNGPYANPNPHNKHEDKLLINKDTGIYEIWNDDDFSIDVLNQYILRDMYAEYGTFATEKITDGWVNYDVWDMGGGHRQYGAYGLMKKFAYLAHFAGNTEFGNMYNVNGEPYIANETLGISAAGMPNVAAEQAEIFGGVTSDRDPTEWLKFFTAMISMSYFEDDVKTLIREAQKVLPDDSHPSRVIDRMFELYETYPDDWRRSCVIAEQENFRDHYDLNVIRGETGINCSFMVLGLLYGDGDYYETCKIISLAGHGGDSTTPGPLTVIGIITGWSGLDEEVKAVINEKIWQDGKAVLVNLPIASMDSGYHMYCGGLPERITLVELLDLYQANFENILVENGGFIKDGYYYIPKQELRDVDTYLAEDFESGKLDGYKTLGTASVTEDAYSGNVSAKVSGNDKSDSEIYALISGLTVGKTYRVSAFIGTSASTEARMFARESGKAPVYATVYDQTAFVKRVLEFTATAETMEVGISVAKGTAAHHYAIMDELCVVLADVRTVGSASVASPSENNVYSGKVTVNVSADNGKENYLVLTFANGQGKTVNASVTVDGASYAGVPFYKTGAAGNEATNTVYVPVIAKDKKDFTVEFKFDGTLCIYSAELAPAMY